LGILPQPTLEVCSDVESIRKSREQILIGNQRIRVYLAVCSCFPLVYNARQATDDEPVGQKGSGRRRKGRRQPKAKVSVGFKLTNHRLIQNPSSLRKKRPG
jgi:hypothetical protein